MGVNIFYNGVTLYNVLTRDFEQTPVYDDSETDLIHHRFNIRVQALLNAAVLAQVNPQIGINVPGASTSDRVAAIMAILHRQLSTNRGVFQYIHEGAVLLQVDPCNVNSAQADANNGPRVSSLAITHVSPITLRIEVGFELAVKVCQYEPGGTTSNIVSNRWSSADDVDEDFKTTRHWRGKVRVHRPIQSPHEFRGLVVPSLLKGWKRERMHFTGEANGLELSYEITDRQLLGPAPPSPATKMRCTHTETMKEGGAYCEASMSIRLDGPRDADKKKLLERCMQIIDAKLDLNKAANGYLRDLTTIDYIDENTNAVECQATLIRVNNINDAGDLSLNKFAEPLTLPDYDKDTCVLKGPYGTASLAGLFACYLQSPCSNPHNFPNGTQKPQPQSGSTGEYDPSAAEPQITYSNGPATNEIEPVSYASDHHQALYVYCRMESWLLRHENRVQLPIAKSNASQLLDSAIVIRLAPPTAQRRVKLTAERLGAYPKLWKCKDFDAGGFGHKLLHSDFNHRPPEVTGDGKKLYAVDGDYLFALNRAPTEDEALPVGALMWDTISAGTNHFTSQDYLEPTDSAKGLG